MHVLRLCSVFEPPAAVLAGSGVRFDPIGGMQNHTGQLTRALARMGVAQSVVTTRPPGAPRVHAFAPGAVVRRHGLPVRTARQLYSVPAAWTVARLAGTADLVHAHVGEDLAVLPLALAGARRAGVPLVVTVHTSLAHTFEPTSARTRLLKRAGGAIEQAVTARASRVVVLTPRLARRLVDGGVPAERVHVIPSGVAPAEFAAPAPDPFPDAGRPRVLFLGRLAPQKGTSTLAAAAARLRHPGARLLVVGDGPDRPRLEAAVRRHGLEHRVRLAGFRPHAQVPAILAHADVLVMPSLYEELGTVAIEAMRAGLPIVASDTGGLPEALGDAAVLVPPGDAGALAAAVDGLLADPARAAALGAAARERARAYEWPDLAAAVLDVYRLALDRPVAATTPEALEEVPG